MEKFVKKHHLNMILRKYMKKRFKKVEIIKTFKDEDEIKKGTK